MLIETDRNQLGDSRLNPDEYVLKEREALLKMMSDRKIYGQAELEDTDRAAGPRLHASEIISRLRRCNPELQIRDGLPGNVALYIRKRADEMEEPDPHRNQFGNDHRYCGGFALEWLPEWGFIKLDSSNLPVREYRGWRTVLTMLIRAGAISYKSAIREFGDPGTDKRAGRWHEQLATFKSIS